MEDWKNRIGRMKDWKIGRLEEKLAPILPSFHPSIQEPSSLPIFQVSRFTFHILLTLVCMSGLGCSRNQSQISTADLRAHLQPIQTIETYAGFEATNNLLYFGNRFIARHILLNGDTKPVQTIRYRHKPSGQNYVSLPSEEFRFRVGEINFSGDSEWLSYDSYRIEQGFGGQRRIIIRLTYFATLKDAFSGLNRIESLRSDGSDPTAQGSKQRDVPHDESTQSAEEGNEKTPIFHLELHYDIHPALPVIRKWLIVQNLTDVAFSLEDITVESLPLFAGKEVDLHIWGASHLEQSSESTGSNSIPIPWSGGVSEAFVILWDANINGGVVFGNEGAGILKYYQIGNETPTPVMVSTGMPPRQAINGVEIRVPPKQSVSSPIVWTMLFDGGRDAVAEILERVDVISAVGEASQPRPVGEASQPRFPSLIWTQPSQKWQLPSEVAKDTFIAVDYDWNSENHPILKQMSQQIHDSGDKFAIRLPIAEISTDFLDRTAWRLTPTPVFQFPPKAGSQEIDETEGKQATPSEEGGQSPQDPATNQATYCILSDYGYYISSAIKTLLEETSPDLLILDRSLLGASDSLLMGCSAYGHEHYSRAESIPLTYRWLFGFAEHLRQEYPGLQLGITSAAYGIERADSACFAHFDFFLR